MLASGLCGSFRRLTPSLIALIVVLRLQAPLWALAAPSRTALWMP